MAKGKKKSVNAGNCYAKTQQILVPIKTGALANRYFRMNCVLIKDSTNH